MPTRNKEHIRQFYEENQRSLFTYALSITQSQERAEDILHNVFTELLQQKSLPNDIKPYTFRAIRNRAIDSFRRQQHQIRHIAESIFKTDTSRPLVETRLLIEEALLVLSDNERDAIVLKTYSGLTLQEIADLHEVSINTVSSWYRRGLEKMRNHIEEVPHE